MPPSRSARNRFPAFPGGLGVEAGGRLVEDDHLGPAEEGQREVQSAALAAGELFHADVAAACDSSGRAERLVVGPGALVQRVHIRAVSPDGQLARAAASWSITPIGGQHAGPVDGSWPSTRTRPAGGADPSTSSSVEVLPAPLVPSSAKISPRPTEK